MLVSELRDLRARLKKEGTWPVQACPASDTKQAAMKPRHAAALSGKCQGNGCPRVGRQRTDMLLKRTLFLCSVCYDALPLYQLRQLFQDVGADVKKQN